MPGKTTHTCDDAAEAFFGQSEKRFEKQIAAICRADDRLVAVFRQTRARYLAQKSSAG